MKKWSSVLLVVVMVGFVIAFVRVIPSMFEEPQTVQGASANTPQKRVTKTPQPTVTIGPTADLVDHAATAQVALTYAENAQATANSAINMGILATQVKEQANHQEAMQAYNIESTRVANDSRRLSLTETQTVLEITSIPVMATIQNGILTMESSKATQVAEYPARQKELALVPYQGSFAKASLFFEYSVPVMLVVLAAMLGIVLWHQVKTQKAQVPERIVSVPAPKFPLPDGKYIAGVLMTEFDMLLPREMLRDVAIGVLLHHKTFSHNNFTPSEICMSESVFSELQNLFDKYELGEWTEITHKGGMPITDKGKVFLRAFLPGVFPEEPPPHPIDTTQMSHS